MPDDAAEMIRHAREAEEMRRRDEAEENRRHERVWWFLVTAFGVTVVIVFGLIVQAAIRADVERERMRFENEREHPPVWRKG